MLRNLGRRGASVLVAGALLGGGLALGGGTASAVEAAPGSVSGSVGSEELGPADVISMLTLGVLVEGGSADRAYMWRGCAKSCPPPGTPVGILSLFDWLMGNPPGTSIVPAPI